ncbi:hypothetical protein P5V15_008338 [Pogonomyrmex californicus]
MHITSKISSVHDGNNKRAFDFPSTSLHLKKNAAEAIAMICAAYGENAVSHTTCKRWYQKFRQGDFSLEDEPRAGRPQKIETDELQALLDINSAQLKRSLALRSKPFPYVYIRWERFRKKADRFRMNCPKTTKIVGVRLHSFCFQSSEKKIFCTKSLQAMKSGFFMITLNVENHGLTLVNL